jgi:N6-adenosine-specific RNA methylase IME4
MPVGKHYYKAIMLDCPWEFTKLDGTKIMPSRAKKQAYKTLSLQELAELPVLDLADPKGCMVFSWTTKIFMEWQFWLFNRWEENYRRRNKTSQCWKSKTTALTWVKRTKHDKEFFGGGYYFRSNPEPCLLAVWGNPKIMSHSVRELMIEERPALHSKKPDETYRRIDELCGDVPKLELFGRQAWPGWISLGSEIDGLDINDSMQKLLVDPSYLERVTNRTDVLRPGANLSVESLKYYASCGFSLTQERVAA